MPRRSRRPERPPAGPVPVPPLPPMGLVLGKIPTLLARTGDVVVEPRRRVIRVVVPGMRVSLASDAPVDPLVLTIRRRDRAAWLEAIARDPTCFGTLVFEALLATDAPTPRGRHGRRAMSVAGRTLRVYAAEIYLTLERWAHQDARAGFEALQRHAKARGYAWRQMERGKGWHLRRVTAYVVEVGYPGAYDKAAPPTTDPETFYRTYIWSPQLLALRAALVRTPFPHAQALLDRLIAEAPPPPRPTGADVPPVL
jgi:hypothetical protein